MTSICCSVNMMLSEKTTRSTTISGMLSPDGRCKTLDASANGYVRAESVTCLVMENRANNDMINPEIPEDCFVVNASYINQDGRTSSLTAPNGQSQQRVISGAMASAEVTIHEM